MTTTGLQGNEPVLQGPCVVGDQSAIVSDQPGQGHILNYTIREDGWLAVVIELEGHDYKDVNIYDNNHMFQKSYRMWPSKAIYADWHRNGNLLISSSAGELIHELSSEGVIRSVAAWSSYSEERAYIKNLTKSKKIVGNRTYISRLRFKWLRPIALFQDELVCIEKGKETVVYYSPTFEGVQGLLILFVIPIWLFCEVKWQVIDPGREKERKKRQAKTQPD